MERRAYTREELELSITKGKPASQEEVRLFLRFAEHAMESFRPAVQATVANKMRRGDYGSFARLADAMGLHLQRIRTTISSWFQSTAESNSRPVTATAASVERYATQAARVTQNEIEIGADIQKIEAPSKFAKRFAEDIVWQVSYLFATAWCAHWERLFKTSGATSIPCSDELLPETFSREQLLTKANLTNMLQEAEHLDTLRVWARSLMNGESGTKLLPLNMTLVWNSDGICIQREQLEEELS